MKRSYNWLKKYIYTSVDIKLILTDLGFNVEKLKKINILNSYNKDLSILRFSL